MKYIIATILMCMLFVSINAQPGPNMSPASAPGPKPGDSVSSKKIATVTAGDMSLNKSSESTPIFGIYTLSIFVLIFGMIIVLALMYQYTNIKTDFTSEHAVRIISITLIITGLLFIVSLFAASAQNNGPLNTLSAPAFGLLGTMAGYLLGKSTFKDNPLAKAGENNDTKKQQILMANQGQGMLATQDAGAGQAGAEQLEKKDETK